MNCTLTIRLYVLVYCLLLATLGFTQNTPAESPDSIKLSSIQTEYEKILSEIPAVVKQYTDTLLLHSRQEELTKYSATFANIKKESDRLLNRYVSTWQISNLESKLNRSETNFKNLIEEVSSTSTQIETQLFKIKNLLTEWNSLRTRVQSDPISKSLLPQIQEVIALLRNAEKLLQKQLTSFLKIQNETNRLQIENSEYINMVNIAEHNTIVKLFDRNTNFIWNNSDDTFDGTQSIADRFKIGTKESIEYLKEKWRAIILLLGIGVLLFFAFYYLRVKKLAGKEKTVDEPLLLVYNNITAFPIASSMSALLLISFFVLDNRPALLSELLLITFALPLLIFTIGKSIISVWIYWIIFLLYCLNVILLHIPLVTQLQNIVLLVITLLSSGMLLWMYKNPTRYLVNSISAVTKYIKRGFVSFFFYLSCLTFVVGVIGYIELSKLLISGIVASLYIGPIVLICSLIIRNFLQALSHTFLLEDSYLVKKYFPLLIKLISISAILLWLLSSLRVFGLLPFIQRMVENIWSFGGTFGAYTISIGDVISIILIIIVSLILSNFIQILLEEEIFSRVKVARGVPMAIGVMGKYFVIITGFFLAIAATGFDLTKMSIIAGALGVGVGFGLQNLVANFVSGMILIFERPILVGDIIEAEGEEGQVTQIGIRASKILTYAGAEVVIPNSNLINNRVSNWTLSNRKRRFTIEVRTNKDADPAEIVATMTAIAREHPHVIKDPAAFVIFEGQADQSLRFKVYYWQVGELLSTRSDLNIQIYKALKDQGVELSIPVYEIKKIE